MVPPDQSDENDSPDSSNMLVGPVRSPETFLDEIQAPPMIQPEIDPEVQQASFEGYRIVQPDGTSKMFDVDNIPRDLRMIYELSTRDEIATALEGLSKEVLMNIKSCLEIPRMDANAQLRKIISGATPWRIPAYLCFLSGQALEQWKRICDSPDLDAPFRNTALSNLSTVLSSLEGSLPQDLQVLVMGVSAGALTPTEVILKELHYHGVTDIDLQMIEFSWRMLHDGLIGIFREQVEMPTTRVTANLMNFDQLKPRQNIQVIPFPACEGVPRLISNLGVTGRTKKDFNLLQAITRPGDLLLVDFRTLNYSDEEKKTQAQKHFSRPGFKEFALNGLYSILKGCGIGSTFLESYLRHDLVNVELDTTRQDLCFSMPSSAKGFDRVFNKLDLPEGTLRHPNNRIILFRIPLFDSSRNMARIRSRFARHCFAERFHCFDEVPHTGVGHSIFLLERTETKI